MTPAPAAAEVMPEALMAALVLDDGRPWGEVAHAFQVHDARAILDTDASAPRLHLITRPRGGSKTTDVAAVALVALLTQAPAHSTSHAYARDKDQAQLLMTALTALAHRSGLAGLLDLQTWAVTVKATGARLVVETADAASAYGHIPWLVVVDELAQWPTTRAARTLWEAIVSGLPKRPDSRLVVITTAGDPAHWSAKIRTNALTSEAWRVSETPGPLPWISEADLDEQRRLLPASSFARLHLNEWTAADDRLVSHDDLAACVTLDGPLDADPRHRYVIGLDLGLKRDRTVMTVAHAEYDTPTAPPRVVLDRIAVLQGTPAHPVQLADVESLVLQAAQAYRATVRVDPWQATGLAQRLRSRGVTITEWSFTAASVGRLAVNLHLLLREHRLALPDDPDLLDELATVRLRETNPGVFRLDHDSGHHDDRAVALGLAALALTEKAREVGGVTVPKGKISDYARGNPSRQPSARQRAEANVRARQMTANAVELPSGGLIPTDPLKRRLRG
ncbi:MAG: terminase large subunit domain-containing protein [Gulosibacter sp.]|uniref:terminase large subunit domain-containing protein n=1 Tax=Gulosibacter sp. TaxID=2817531 RepID=UPI003F92047D